jgi:hypothetical protein
MSWLKLNRWLNFRERNVLDTSWFQRQMLKKKYQGKKQDQSYGNKAKMNRPPAKTRLAKSANSNLISFVPKNSGIRNIKNT